jgi:hypothetical protein
LLDRQLAVAAPPDELLEQVGMVLFRSRYKGAQIVLGLRAVAKERCDLRGDQVTALGDRLFADGECISKSNRELTDARITARRDGALDKGDVVFAAHSAPGPFWAEPFDHGRIDDVRVAPAEPSQDRPRDAVPRGIVTQPRIHEGELGQSEWTAEAESQSLEVAEGNGVLCLNSSGRSIRA